jgi:outer membrane lipoprotein SlyB
MDTTVTGIFQSKKLASLATKRLVSAGFRPDQLRVVDSGSPDRHVFIDKKTSGTRRAVILGVVLGATGGALAGAALAGVFGLVQATLAGGLAVAAGGALLGCVVGRSTKSQIQDELEHQVDAGTVLVSVTTDSTHGPSAMHLLAKEGDPSMVATAASFTAAVLPTNQN